MIVLFFSVLTRECCGFSTIINGFYIFSTVDLPKSPSQLKIIKGAGFLPTEETGKEKFLFLIMNSKDKI